ncbi:hypothetical protein BH11ACT7_BH11ACT7_27800 [soil metagenome]
MESLFSHPYQPETVPNSENSADTEAPVFSDRPTQNSGADRPPLS